MFAGFAPVTADLGFAIVPAPGLPWGGAHRQLTPGGLRESLDWLASTYPNHPDVIITENGVGYPDEPNASGVVQDDPRIEYLRWAIQEVADAIADGVRVRGYHAWSSHDNLQYMAGFSQRFGLIHVDPHTLVRTPKASFEWYREVVRTGSVPAPHDQVSAGDHLGIDVPGVRNARGIGGLETLDGRRVRDGLVFRSAGLHGITEEGRHAVAGRGVSTVLDLRGATEVASYPDDLPDARVVHLPLHEPSDPDSGVLIGAAADAADSLGLAALYAHLVQSRGREIAAGIREIAMADGAVLVHCTAGKDRTGILIAVLLAALGVRDDQIVSTYAESGDLLGEGFRADVAELLPATHPEALTQGALDELLASPVGHIELALETIRRDHGTVAAYLGANGFTGDELADLREKFLA